MISSVSAWGGGASSMFGVDGAKRSGGVNDSAFDYLSGLLQSDNAAKIEALASEDGSNAAFALSDNNVKASIVAAALGVDSEAQDEQGGGRPGGQASGGGAEASAGAEGSDEVSFRTIVLADGTKMLQTITKHADGSTETTATRLQPGPNSKTGPSGFDAMLETLGIRFGSLSGEASGEDAA